MISVDIFKKFRNKKTKNNKSEINSGSTLNISLQQDNYLKDITYEQQYNIIKQSGLFDSEFYEKKYTDVSKRKLDPIRHFIRHGYKENRWPNEFFDPVYYKKAYSIEDGIIPLTHYIQTPQAILNRTSEKFDGSFYYYLHDDVRKAGINPLYHYLKHGKDEKRAIGKKVKEQTKTALINIPSKLSKINITIIVPVYNAINEVMDCLDSVIQHTKLGQNIKLLVINDASPDKSVQTTLNKYKTSPGVTIIHNKKNIGYTNNVNLGISLSGNDDIILLNSDTVVSKNWLRQMSIAAYQNDDIGTVTAISNGAGAFSVPKSGWNDLPDHLSINHIARLVSSAIDSAFITTPTGNGFCLFIKRELLNQIGVFDKEKFPRGYGEENDFCMRALSKGWINIVDLKTYIYHKRSASFKGEKELLIGKGISQVKNDHPYYSGAIKAIGNSTTFIKARKTIESIITKISPNEEIVKPKILFVISTRTGGTPKTNYDLMRSLKDIYDCYVLASNSKLIEIMRADEKDYKVIEKFHLSDPVNFATHRSFEYEQIVRSVIYKYSIELLHIRHIAWHSLKLPEIAKDMGIPVINSFHDFYTICPSVNLVNENGELFIDGLDHGTNNPLWRDETVTHMTPSMLKAWKTRMEEALLNCDQFITTCESAKEIILKNLPNIQGIPFTVIPHGRDFTSFLEPKTTVSDNIINVLIPGNITLTKGKILIKKIKELDKNNKIKFHVLGTCDKDIMDIVTYHGKYNRDDFITKVKLINPDISAVFSIWPETYCHTLTESWASGLPVVGLAYGAVEKRINKHNAGWLVSNNAQECYEQLIFLCNNPQEIKEKQKNVAKWQEGYGAYNTVSRMTEKYIHIYQDACKINLPAKRIMGIVLKGYYPNVPPTAYVRLIDWKHDFEEKYNLKVEFIPWHDLLTYKCNELNKVIIQRDAIPSYAVDWCINSLTKNKIPYDYEIDDNLLNVPEIVDIDGIYRNYRTNFQKLISNANTVHVTNNSLADIVREYNSNIIIRPNKIFSHRWNTAINDQEKIDFITDSSIINVLYFGSRTHQEDLNFLSTVINQINDKKPRFHLYVIGCGDFTESKFITRLTPPSSRYDLFVNWLIRISHNFDVGVAPLIDERFANTKSPLKAIELMALNLPVICSDISPYSDLKNTLNMEDYQKIRFVKNTSESWQDALIKFKGCYDDKS
ncbi:glycosyltransferase [Leclercia adecarboxylata]|uniref:Glycosyltransferase n=6 Tax=Leclercia adecarboxylata TaxID=83655 RepID=A0A9X4BEQ9_9ENTR|nr:glycosyltransferase [Leclercia adecarboxylata]MDC6623871.1 glycosyltransferase [Leclercia adecarboxylata]MDC6632693.1 glycosyltransferase [Leclercia adecarboxylata]MDC6639878.1 glycosyltransferase [Leclercia adecarboxylata]MDC6651792.1 glycosyltransferase [Leclercia adecarboxylata]MDC6653307.1 glycosyltransferase [Leclercia adecarboxylata]